MNLRTDLAVEKIDKNGQILQNNWEIDGVKINETEIPNADNPQKYATVEFCDLGHITDFQNIENILEKEIKKLIPKNWQTALAVGLGNADITADAIGTFTAKKILATRHIVGEFAEKIGISGLKSVAVLTPDVLGKTGIESAESVQSAVERVEPDFVLVIDALATSTVSRLFRTVQITNAGISPGSGVKNSRKELSEKTLKVPVIAVGVPTVVDAKSLAFELTEKESVFESDLIVTPKDADFLCRRISEILTNVLNRILQPELDRETLAALV